MECIKYISIGAIDIAGAVLAYVFLWAYFSCRRSNSSTATKIKNVFRFIASFIALIELCYIIGPALNK